MSNFHPLEVGLLLGQRLRRWDSTEPANCKMTLISQQTEGIDGTNQDYFINRILLPTMGKIPTGPVNNITTFYAFC